MINENYVWIWLGFVVFLVAGVLGYLFFSAEPASSAMNITWAGNLTGNGSQLTDRDFLSDYYDSFSKQYFNFYCSERKDNSSEIYVKVTFNYTTLFDGTYGEFCDLLKEKLK